MPFTSVSVLIVATDEEESLKKTVDDAIRLCGQTRPEKVVLSLSANASPGCRDAAEECRKKYPGMAEVIIQRRPGIGGAVLDAVDAISSSHIIGLTADYSLSIDTIPLMIEGAKAEPDTIFKNSRYLAKNGFDGYGRLKKLFNICGQRFLRLLFNSDLTDLTSPMQIMPAALYRRINWKESGFPFFLEMVLIPLRTGVKIKELPARSLPRTEGVSKNSFLKTAKYLLTAFRIRFTSPDKLLKTENV